MNKKTTAKLGIEKLIKEQGIDFVLNVISEMAKEESEKLKISSLSNLKEIREANQRNDWVKAADSAETFDRSAEKMTYYTKIHATLKELLFKEESTNGT